LWLASATTASFLKNEPRKLQYVRANGTWLSAFAKAEERLRACKAPDRKAVLQHHARSFEGFNSIAGRKEAADNQERCSQINAEGDNSVRLSACKYPTRPRLLKCGRMRKVFQALRRQKIEGHTIRLFNSSAKSVEENKKLLPMPWSMDNLKLS